MFELQPMAAEFYRSQTRRSTLMVCVILAASCFLMANLSIFLFGEPGGDNNFRWNLAGVIAGLLLTIALVRKVLWEQPWMAAAVYGLRLKHQLMKITNMLHQVEAAVAEEDPTAMKVLRFYHLGLIQMHTLEGNQTAISDLVKGVDRHLERMTAMGLAPEQNRLEQVWLDQISQRWRHLKRR